jgi:hypothetical protein
MPQLAEFFKRDSWDAFADVVAAALDLVIAAIDRVTAAIRLARITRQAARDWETATANVDAEDQRQADMAKQREQDRKTAAGHDVAQQAGRGFEGVTDIYKRLNQAAARQGYDKQSADHTKQTAKNTADIKEALNKKRPPLPAVGL